MAAILAAGLVLAGCGPKPAGGGDDGGSEAAGGGGAGRYDGQWQLVAGQSPSGPLPVPRQVTMTIHGSEISGTSACNQYFGTAAIDGSSFSVKDVGSTGMGCPGKRMVAEERYHEALAAADEIAGSGPGMTITGPQVELQFEPVAPVEPAAFEDTTWHLQSLVFGNGPEGTVTSTQAPATLVFTAGGRLTGTTGCVDLDGRWERDGETVTVTGLPDGDVDCSVAGDQNDHVLKVLRSPFTAAVDERLLTITADDGGVGLQYSAD